MINYPAMMPVWFACHIVGRSLNFCGTKCADKNCEYL